MKDGTFSNTRELPKTHLTKRRVQMGETQLDLWNLEMNSIKITYFLKQDAFETIRDTVITLLTKIVDEREGAEGRASEIR